MNRPETARQTVLAALVDMEAGGYSGVVLRRRLKSVHLEKEDRNFTTRLFNGVLERKRTLDYLLSPHVNRRVDVEVLAILRMGVYQISYMDVPPHTAVDESVELCLYARKASAKGFVNGVLRSFLRGETTPNFLKISDFTDRVSIQYSCDPYFAHQLIADWGEERAVAILASSLEAPSIYGRVNTLKTTTEKLIPQLEREDMVAVPTFLPGCIRFIDHAPVEQSRLFQEGFFHVQDLSSQLCAAAVTEGLQQRGKVLDLCAAPGGKTFSVAENMGDQGDIRAFDVHDFKLDQIWAGLHRLGIQSVKLAEQDASVFLADLAGADRVLCDVPCSGFGTIGKRPEIKYKQKKEYQGLPFLQLKILENAARYLESGSVLIYSTCTLLKNENEKVVESFLKRNQQMVPRPLPPVFGKSILANAPHMAVIFPDTFHSDGFFVAAMEKE